MRVRVYNPETNEPFDVPQSRADYLRLEKGWLSQPFTQVESDSGEGEDDESESWRQEPLIWVSGESAPDEGSEKEDEVEPAPAGRGRRRKAAED